MNPRGTPPVYIVAILYSIHDPLATVCTIPTNLGTAASAIHMETTAIHNTYYSTLQYVALISCSDY